MIIYKTTNLINGKFYVGKDEKNNPNYLGSGINLNRAIKKYGKENFIKETIEVCSTKEELNEREKYWIKETKAQELGYNIADGGWGGNTYDEETRQRISQEFKGRKVDPKTIEKAKKTREKRKQENPDVYKISEEQKQILSKTHKGKVHPEEWRQRQSEVMKELYNSDNSKFEKFIENQKGENKRGEKNPMWGRKATEETRRKQSEALKQNPARYWLGKKQSPESNEKRSQSRINKKPEELLEIYIKSHISKKGYGPSEEQKLKKLEEYRKKKEK